MRRSLVLGDATEGALQPAYFLGVGGLGAALYLIHMYVDPIKKAMQAMWAAGFVGSVGIAVTTGEAAAAPFSFVSFVRSIYHGREGKRRRKIAMVHAFTGGHMFRGATTRD